MRITKKQFEIIVEEGIGSLPQWVQEKIVNLAFLVADEPSKKQREEHNLGEGETLFGLYEGVPLTERGEAPPEMPDRITIFRKPILETYDNPGDVRACVENTIWHEVAHYFGHGEDWVEEEERKRGKLL